MTIPSIDRRGLLSLMLGAAALGVTAPAAMADVDFSGKRVEMIVPYAAGGSSAAYGQFMALMLKKHLPGNPTVVVRNVPGAGGIVGVNEFARTAKPDGLTLLSTGTSALLNSALGNKAVRYDLEKFDPLIVSPAGVVVYVSKSLGVSNAEEFKKLLDQKLTVGAFSATSADLPVLLCYDLLRLDINAVFGLEGSGARRQAFQRGEFKINFDAAGLYASDIKPLIDAGEAVPLFTFGVLDANGKFIRDQVAPELPTFIEFYEQLHGKPPSGTEFEAWKTVFAARVMTGKTIIIPAATPDHIKKIYHTAFANIVKDPDFTNEKGLNIVGPYDQPLGDAAASAYKAAGTLKPELKEWLVGWLKTKFDVSP